MEHEHLDRESGMGQWQIQKGWDVFGANGDEVGNVDDVQPTYIKVQKGFIFTSDLYIPLSAVSRVDYDRVYLNLSKDEIDNRGWDQPPLTDTTMDRDVDTGYREARDIDRADLGDTESDDTLELREERLQAHTEPVEAGEVRLGKDVVTEERTMDVPVRREEVEIERHPVDARPASGDIGDGGEIRMPVREEQVKVDKDTVVTGEVGLKKHAVEETERASDTIRKEKPAIEHEGDIPLRGDDLPRQ